MAMVRVFCLRRGCLMTYSLEYVSSSPYSPGHSFNVPTPTRSIPIVSSVAHPLGRFSTAGYTSNSLQYHQQWVHQPGHPSGCTGFGPLVPTFSQPKPTLLPDQGHPFGYPRLTAPCVGPSAQSLLPHNWSYSEPAQLPGLLARSKSLQHYDTPRFSHEESYLPDLVARPATSWPAKGTRVEHGPIDPPGSNRPSFSGSLPGIEGGSFAISPPASSDYHSSHPVTPRDASPHLPPSPATSWVTLPFIGLASDEQITDFVCKSFPDGTPSFEAYRVALRQVLNSEWKRNNTQEPHKSHLLQFIVMNGTKWECLFYVGPERCSCSSTRKIQALEHIRRHIKLEPFVCVGGPW
jgi:hypothetical protein